MPSWSPFQLEHTPDITDIQWLAIRTVGFVLILAIVWRFIVPMVGGLLRDRQVAIEQADNQVKATLGETERMRNEYRQRLEQIEDETEQRMEAAVREAEDLRSHIQAEAREAATGLLERARQDVEQERRKTFVHLRSEFVDDVVRAAGFAAAQTVDASTQRRLVQEFARDLGAPS